MYLGTFEPNSNYKLFVNQSIKIFSKTSASLESYLCSIMLMNEKENAYAKFWIIMALDSGRIIVLKPCVGYDQRYIFNYMSVKVARGGKEMSTGFCRRPSCKYEG
jgi:hypothetical protein